MLVPLVLLSLPFFVLFNNDPNYADEPTVLPVLITSLITLFFAYVMIRNYKIIRIELDENRINIIDVVKSKKLNYLYSDVKKIESTTYRIQGVTKLSGRSRDINFASAYSIFFKDELELVIDTDVYSNCIEMINYIESHKPVIQTL